MSVQRNSSTTNQRSRREALREDGAYYDPETGDITWVYWSAQEEAIEAVDSGEYDIVVFRGGYGSGKSVLGARQTWEIAKRVPNSDNLVMAQDSAKGGPTTYKVLFEQLPGEDTVPDRGGDPENSPWVADYNRNKSRVTLPNGAVVRLGSADQWNRYAGAEFNWVWCDEVAHYTNTNLYKLNRMLISRQRTSQGPNTTLWTSTGNGYNDFYDFVERQVTPDGDEVTTRIKNVVADSRQNPFLNEKEKLTRQFEGTEAEDQGLAGGFAAAEGLVYSKFSRSTHIRPHEQLADRVGDWRIYGYDAGWDDPRVVLELGRTGYGQLAVLDEMYESESQPSDVIDEDDGTGWLEDKQHGRLYCEHEPAHIGQFRNAGWNAVKAEKDLDEGITAVRGRLKPDEAEGRPGLLVSDRCTNVIQEFMSYKSDHVGKSKAEDHALDALRYAIFTDSVWQEREPRDEDSSGVHTF